MEYDRMSKKWLEQRDDAVFLNRSSQGDIASLAIPTPDHYYPLLYTLGLKNRNDELQFFNEKVNYGSISMRSMVYGANV
jgi:4,5-DOPA dioxygenase extradiol